MKKRIIICYVIIFLIFGLITNVHAQDILYNENVKDYTTDQIKEKWKTNQKRKYISNDVENIEDYSKISILTTKKDGSNTNVKKYLYYWSINQIVDESGNQDYLRIDIDDLNISVNNYKEIRMTIGYAVESSPVNLVKTYGLKIYTYDENGIQHGPYYLDDYKGTGLSYWYDKGRTVKDVYVHGYDLIAQNLKDNGNYTIKKIEIIPYGNLPIKEDPDKTFSSDWHRQSSLFYVSNIKIEGYKSGESYASANKKYENLTEGDINSKRIKAAHRMYDLATLKWSPTINMSATANLGGFNFRNMNKETGELKFHYKTGEFYYGTPYTQRNRVLVEKFYSLLDKNKKLPSVTEEYYKFKNADGEYQYTVDEPPEGSTNIESNITLQSREMWGDDCAASVSYSLSKYLPLSDIYDTGSYSWDRNKTKLLGDLNINGFEASTRSTYDNLYNDYINVKRTSSLNNDINKHINQRIKSNTKRVWNLTIDNSATIIEKGLGYVDLKTNNDTVAIDSDDHLKLQVDNINLTGGSSVKLKFKYYIRKEKNGTTLDENLNKEDIVVKFCTNTNCANGSITMSNVENVNDKYQTQEVIATYTPISNITRVEIMPYGENTTRGRVFILDRVSIDVNNNIYYNLSANTMNEIFDISENADSSALIYSDYITKLHNLGTDFSESEKNKIISKFLARQDIYKGYRDLMIGDTVATHSKEGATHVRLITGNTHVECIDGTILTTSSTKIDKPTGSCDGHGGINPYKSYYIRSDINSLGTNTSEATKNYYGGLIDNYDYVAASSWEPNDNYTDLQKEDIMGIKRKSESNLYLEGKNLNFYLNVKNTFLDGINKSYLPITFNDYSADKIEKPYAILTNPNTYEDIKAGFKGSIYSNYAIISVNISIKDNVNNISKFYTIYPNRRAIGKEGMFTNDYSLYYNLPDDNNEVNEVLNGLSDDYAIKISVVAGEESIKVLDLEPKKVNNISIKENPTKTLYVQNAEDLDLNGGKLMVTFNDGSTDTISLTSEYLDISGFTNTTVGKKTITVGYQGLTAFFDVEVISKQLSSISVTTLPKEKYVQYIDNFDPTGGILSLKYNDNSVETISLANKGITFAGFDNQVLGNKTITVNYLGKTTTFTIEVINNPIESISIDTLPIKTKYVQNSDNLDLTGGKLKVTYTDDIIDIINLDNANIQVSGFDNTMLGKQEITIIYYGRSATFEIEVIKKEPVSIRVEKRPIQTEYIENYGEFDPTGGILEVTYNDKSTSRISFEDTSVTFANFDNTKLGKEMIKIYYHDLHAEFEIEIISKQIIEVQIEELPIKSIYIMNSDNLDLIGGILRIKYTDETEDRISFMNNSVKAEGFDNTNVGENKITINYQGHKDTFNVLIKDTAVEKIEIKKQPLKKYYIVNQEDVDLTGGILEVTYKDGSIGETSMLNEHVKVKDFDNKKVGKTNFKIEYYKKTVEQRVEIVAADINEVEVPNTSKYNKLIPVGIFVVLIGSALILLEKRRLISNG